MGLAVLATVTLIARPSLAVPSLPGYLVGALVGHGTGEWSSVGFGIGRARIGRMLRSGIRRPHAGTIAALVLLLSIASTSRFLPRGALVVIAGIETAISMLALTAVDDRSVRFQTIAGQGAWRIIGRQARGALLFLVTAAPMSAFAFGPALPPSPQ